MVIELSRLRSGEWALGAGAPALLASSFLDWYALTPPPSMTYATLGIGSPSRDAWSSLGRGALADPAGWSHRPRGVMAAGRAPSASAAGQPDIVLLPLALLLALLLINRVLIAQPASSSPVTPGLGAALRRIAVR